MGLYLKTIKKYWYLIILIIAVITCFSFGYSVIQTPKYSSTVKLLIIQKQGQRLDAYTAARSAQAIGEVLTKVIYTSSFFDQVMDSGFKINKEYFSQDPREQRKQWKKTVDAGLIGETGALQINVYHPDRQQAEQIAYGIVYVMVTYGEQYHGGSKQIEIKMIDAPVTSDKPVKPNVFQNTFFGFVFSLLISASLIVLLSGLVKQERKENLD